VKQIMSITTSGSSSAIFLPKLPSPSAAPRSIATERTRFQAG